MNDVAVDPPIVAEMTPSAQQLVGGSLSLDLINTVWQQDGHPFDSFNEDAAVVEFATRNGQSLDVADVQATRAALRAARDLIALILAAPDEPGRWQPDLDRMLENTTVSFDADRFEVSVVAASAVERVAVAALLDVVNLLRSRPERVRACDHPGCMLWFVDTSKAGRRRWCSMATCGNRVKAQRHHARATRRSHA